MKLLLTLSIVSSFLFSEVITLKKCQIYDDFFNKCRVYSKTLVDTENNIECKEQCQFYNEKMNKCEYFTKCEKIKFGFKKRSCDKFDSFFARCNLEREELILHDKRDVDINIKINR